MFQNRHRASQEFQDLQKKLQLSRQQVDKLQKELLSMTNKAMKAEVTIIQMNMEQSKLTYKMTVMEETIEQLQNDLNHCKIFAQNMLNAYDQKENSKKLMQKRLQEKMIQMNQKNIQLKEKMAHIQSKQRKVKAQLQEFKNRVNLLLRNIVQRLEQRGMLENEISSFFQDYGNFEPTGRFQKQIQFKQHLEKQKKDLISAGEERLRQFKKLQSQNYRKYQVRQNQILRQYQELQKQQTRRLQEQEQTHVISFQERNIQALEEFNHKQKKIVESLFQNINLTDRINTQEKVQDLKKKFERIHQKYVKIDQAISVTVEQIISLPQIQFTEAFDDL